MRVDVVTAVHAGYANFLTSAWESLLAQTHPHWTWLVQVDGADAAVRRALSRCGATRDPRVRVDAHAPRQGPAVTRNVALGRGAAALVQNLDADDELEPDALATLIRAVQQHPAAGFAVGIARDLLADGRCRTPACRMPAGLLPAGAIYADWLADPRTPPVHPAGVLWRRDLLVRLGGWAALHGMEDTGTLLAASVLAPCVHVDSPILRYRKHPAQRSAGTAKFRGGGAQIALIRQRTELLADTAGSASEWTWSEWLR